MESYRTITFLTATAKFAIIRRKVKKHRDNFTTLGNYYFCKVAAPLQSCSHRLCTSSLTLLHPRCVCNFVCFVHTILIQVKPFYCIVSKAASVLARFTSLP